MGIQAYRRSSQALGLATLASVAALGVYQPALAADDVVEADAAAANRPTQLEQVDVEGRRGTLEHDTVTTSLTTVQDTPQQITVIDGAQLRNQNINTLEQALRNVPGITVAIGEGGQLGGDQFKIRGFDSKDDVYVDGLRDFGAYTRDSFNYEEVQVLKGPSGAMFGRGTTGGAINTVSKQPRLQDFASVDAYVGAGDYYRGLVDVNRKLGETTAARLTLMGNSTGVVDRDKVYSDRWGAALNIGFGLGTNTKVVVSALHQHTKARPDYGIIIVQPPGDIYARPASEFGVGVERSTFTGYAADIDRNDADLLTVRITHQLNDKVTLASDTRYGSYSRYFQYSTLDQCTAACITALFDGNPATEAFGGNGGQGPYDQDSWGLQNITTARIDYDLGPLKNQAIVGVDLSRQSTDRLVYAYILPLGFATRQVVPRPLVTPDYAFPAGYSVFRGIPGVNISCPATGNCTTPVAGVARTTNTAGTAANKTNGDASDIALFVTDRLWFTDTLSVIGSLRIDRYHAEVNSLFFNNTTSTLKTNSTLKSPRVSLVFEPRDGANFYASWGRSETPQGTSLVGTSAPLAATTKDLDPEVSQIMEVGAKVLVPGTQISAQASLFRIKKDNALQTDPATGLLQAQSGEKQEVTGLELALTGRVRPNWTVSAGYAYLDAEIKQSFSNCVVPTATTGTPTNIVCPVGVTVAIPVANTVAIGRQVLFVPKHSASFYTSYDASAWMDGLSFGGDVTYQSQQSLVYTGRSNSFTDRANLTPTRLGVTPDNITLNAFAAYRTGAYRFSVNVYNITDRLNYSQVFGNRATPAAGRTVIASVGATF